MTKMTTLFLVQFAELTVYGRSKAVNCLCAKQGVTTRICYMYRLVRLILHVQTYW